MKKLVLILGNGFTIDLLSHLEGGIPAGIDLTNLFTKGDSVVWPNGSNERGFLSYKYCPSLWNLGARSNMDDNMASELVENIITCANMISSIKNKPKKDNIYLNAYYELTTYLKHLFIQYNNLILDTDLTADKLGDWGWLKLIKKAFDSKEYEKIVIITYNYDIFLERLLMSNKIPFSIGGLEENFGKVVVLKPHGSISFAHNIVNDSKLFSIRKEDALYEAQLSDFHISYDKLEQNYLVNALIPPAGDSSRLTYKWASELREIVNKTLESITDGDKCVISGISYWHVDRKEIDRLLEKLSENDVDTYMVNPNPPKALNAVLTCVLPYHITYSSSDWIGGIVNE